MSANTKIEWADHTFNPWIGCTKVSPGCDNCYAKAEWDDRRHRAVWGPGQPRSRTKTWGDPEKWNKQAFCECMSCHWRGPKADATFVRNPAGFHPPIAQALVCPSCKQVATLKTTRARVFCASLADVFDNEVPPEWRADLFDLIVTTPHLDWLLLTKRIGNVVGMLPPLVNPFDKIFPNVWIGATIVNQAEADRDIPKLLAVPAAKRFLSMEPLLGPVNLADISDGHADSTIPREYWEEGFDTEDSPPAVGHNCLSGERWQRFGDWTEHGPRIDWVIVGGESGPGARPMHPDWARSLRDQCQAAGVAFLFKQWGEWLPLDGMDPELRIRTENHPWQRMEGTRGVVKVGKKAAGRLLDGRTWDGVPT